MKKGKRKGHKRNIICVLLVAFFVGSCLYHIEAIKNFLEGLAIIRQLLNYIIYLGTSIGFLGIGCLDVAINFLLEIKSKKVKRIFSVLCIIAFSLMGFACEREVQLQNKINGYNEGDTIYIIEENTATVYICLDSNAKQNEKPDQDIIIKDKECIPLDTIELMRNLPMYFINRIHGFKPMYKEIHIVVEQNKQETRKKYITVEIADCLMEYKGIRLFFNNEDVEKGSIEYRWETDNTSALIEKAGYIQSIPIPNGKEKEKIIICWKYHENEESVITNKDKQVFYMHGEEFEMDCNRINELWMRVKTDNGLQCELNQEEIRLKIYEINGRVERQGVEIGDEFKLPVKGMKFKTKEVINFRCYLNNRILGNYTADILSAGRVQWIKNNKSEDCMVGIDIYFTEQ